MAAVSQHRVRGRPAHTPGPTFLSYTPNGRRLITAGSNDSIRIYTTGSVGEPANIDDCQESNTAVVASNDFFITGSEDGTVCMYSLQTKSLDKILVRCTLPVRDVVLSPDGQWAAVASDELVVKVVNTEDMNRVLYLREQAKPVKHLSFHPNGSYIAVSCADGKVYIYSLSKEEPELVKKVDGLIRALETDVEASSKVVWHPDGRAFAAPTNTRDIQVMSWSDWERQRAFASGHTGDITALAWSPNGALLASAGADRKVLLWDTKTQTIIARYDYANVMALAWHPTDNILSFTNSDGELFIYTDFVPTTSVSLLEKTLQPAPFIHDPLAEASANMRRPISDGVKDVSDIRRARRGTPDSLDDILGSDAMDDGDEFLEDDDGAGYAEMSGLRKRTIEDLDGPEEPNGKRRVVHETFRPKRHAPFQPGSTPWRGNRKYLCLNMTGSVWTVDQETHNTVTVEFYDREYHRDFHFTDPYFYDKACLNEEGTLFSCPPLNGSPAMIFYRPHETWTTRADWRTQLPEGEDITSIALSNSYIVVTTSTNYVRIFTLYGTPFRLYRQKSSSTVTCAAWRDYVLTMGNGPVGADGKCTLTYSIENVKRDEVCQSEDVVALPPGGEVRNVFFSDDGDPHIYDSSGTLLVLVHWRSPQQAHWVPLLDTRQLARLASGRHQESYFAVGVAGGRFQCFILKGVAERYPYFPRPLLSEFEFRMPISSAPKKRRRGKSGAGDADAPDNDNVDGHDDDDDDDDGERGGSNGASGPTDQLETTRLETSFLHASLRHALLSDLSTASHVPASSLSTAELEIDKTLLQLLALACRGSSSAAVSVSAESAGPKALELVKLMRDRSGRMVEAAGRVVERFGSGEALAERIREVGEAWLRGDEVEGDEGDELS